MRFILRIISTGVRRRLDYNVDLYFLDRYCDTMCGMFIDFKIFGLFWMACYRYTYYFKK